MKTFFSIAIGTLGVIVMFVWVVLPLRLPRDERNLDREAIATVVGLGLAAVPVFLNRKKKT